MGLKLKIYIVIAVVVIGAFVYQTIVIRNLKADIKSSALSISTLEQNENVLRDSINFKSDSVAVLHTFIKDKEQLNKELKFLYDSIKKASDNSIKDLKKSNGLLYSELKFKNKIIDSLKVQSNTSFTDSTMNIPILYESSEMGLSLDGVAIGNFINKSGYVFWNKIETKLPKLKIGLVYDQKDSTIVAMVEANNQIESFHTAISDELYRLLVQNSLPQKTWIDNIGIGTEFLYLNEPNVNMQIYCEYKNFYLTIGKRFVIFDKLSQDNYFVAGYKLSLGNILSKIK